MKKELCVAAVVAGVVCSVATGFAAEGGKKPIKIIAIGDSITEAYRVIPQAYRYHLAKMMDEKKIAYDFVGSRKGVLQNAGDGSVDMDYEAYSGQRADQVIGPALKTAKAEKPDIALVHLGTNDILMNQGVENAMTDIDTLIKGLKEANPKVQVFLGMIPWNNKPLIEELNNKLKEYAEKGENLHHVEMRPFELNKYYRDFPRYSLHPNEAGALRMAEMYFAAMNKEVFARKSPSSGEVPLAQDREIRTWTSAKGTTISARLMKTESKGTRVSLLKENGEKVQIGAAMLSQEDQDYIKSLVE